MIALGLRVPRSEGETARRWLMDRKLLRTDLEILKEGGSLVLPVRSRSEEPPPTGEYVEREFRTVASAAPTDYRDRLTWPSNEKALLPRSFDVIGDIVLIRLPAELEPRKAEIGEALLGFVPSARLVGQDLGVHGPERLRRVERLAGSGSWRTRHRENGLEFEVDVERAYFSPRLAREHERVAAEVKDGERVFDLCCGVGPFALTIARAGRARHVTAVDSNPDAIALLKATLARCWFSGTVEPVLASLETFLPGAAAVERVVINLPHEGIKYLPSVARVVAPGGNLHYYEVTPRAEFDDRAGTIMRSLGTGGWTAVGHHVVHPYAPTSDVVAYHFARAGP